MRGEIVFRKLKHVQLPTIQHLDAINNIQPINVALHLLSTIAFVAETLAELRQKYIGWCLFRPVRADQSELVGFLEGRWALKRQKLKWRPQRERVNSGAEAMDGMRKKH